MRSAIVLVVSAVLLLAGCPDGGGGGGGTTFTACGAGGTCADGFACEVASNLCLPIVSCATGGCGAGYVCDPGSLICVPEGSCVVAGCGLGFVCNPVSGACVADEPCTADSCPVGLFCDVYDSRCKANPNCADISDCPDGHYCGVESRCVLPPPGGCATNADCDPGYACSLTTHYCDAAISCASWDLCPPGWTCGASKVCEQLPAGTCDYSDDCGTNEDCAAHVCVGCATAGTVCSGTFNACDATNNDCVQCDDDADCLSGRRCLTSGAGGRTCAECLGDADCTDPTLKACSWGRCLECSDDTDCAAGSECVAGGHCVVSLSADCYYWPCSDPRYPYCEPMSDRCAECLDDAHCGAGERCDGYSCAPLLPGDTCAAPLALPLASGRNTLSVNLWDPAYLEGFRCDGEGCDNMLADVYWSFTLAQGTELELGVSGSYQATYPRIELLPAGCGASIVDHVFTGALDRITVSLPAREYVMRFVSYEEGWPSVIVLTASTPTLAAGNSCEDPSVLTLDGAGAASVPGTTVGLATVSGDVCDDGTSAGDAVYALDLAARSFVEVTATPDAGATLLDVEVKDACVSEAPRTCNVTPGAAVTRTLRGAAAGRHYVVVHSEDGTSGSFHLGVATAPWPANDGCSAAAPLSISGGVAAATGSTGDDAALPDAGLYCGGPYYSGNDQFFSLSTVGLGDKRLVLTVTPDAPGTWTPVVSVEAACGATTNVQCAVGGAGSAATLTRDVLDEGQYVVHVVGSGGGGPYTLSATLSAPLYATQPNDTCATPNALTFSAVGSSQSRSGDTRGADDSVAACSAVGPGDVVYQLTMPAGAPRGRVTVTVTPKVAGFDPVVEAETACGGAASCWDGAGAGAPETASMLVSGSAFVWVEGDGGAGSFDLLARYAQAAPANDQCAGRTTLSLTSLTDTKTAMGDLTAAFADGGCAGGAPDAFHQISVAGSGGGGQTVNVTVTPSGFTGKVTLYGDLASCGAGTCTSSATGVAPGAAVTLPVTMRAGQSVIVAVSSADGSVGSYSIQAGP